MSTRHILRLTGDDRVTFLQGILTQDVTRLATSRILFAALLSPQGKLLHDMFLVDAGDAILIDTDAAQAELLKKRLTLYKLRAKVTIADAPELVVRFTAEGLPDPRHPDLPARQITTGEASDMAPYHAMRLALGIPEFGRDIAPDTITAMDAGYDLLGGISFTKGCYVGQEVTARMHYKAIARKGFFHIHASRPLAEGMPITAAGRTLGTLTSAQGGEALAFLKFEDATLPDPMADTVPVAIHAPAWMAPKLSSFSDTSAKQ